MKQERQSNIELLRILSMAGVILIHYIAPALGGMLGDSLYPNYGWFLKQIIYSFACPLVNCFVLITGYFLVTKKTFTLKKAVILFITMVLYGLVGYVFGLLLGTTTFSIKRLFYSLFPIFESKRWFVETYIILILFAPFLNKCLVSLTKEHFKLLIGIQITFFSIWYSFGLSAPILDDGYGIINFITLYMIGAYCRLFGKQTVLKRYTKSRLLVFYLILSGMTFGLSYFINPFGYCFITVILGSVTLFLLFLKNDIGTNRIINEFSASTFDVYFIHSDQYTSHWLFFNVLGGKFVFDSALIVFHDIICVMVLYLIGYCCYRIRMFLYAKTIDKWLDKIPWIQYSCEV